MDSPLLSQEADEEEHKDATDATAGVPKSKGLLQDSDSESDDDHKFNHNLSDTEHNEDDKGYYHDDSLPAKSLKVIKEIISRHYGLLFCCTVFGASIGFIIYLLWSYDVWIYILGFVGFFVALLVDAHKFNSEQRTKLMVDYEPTKEEIEILDKTWSESDDDEFYIQSDFYTPLKAIYRGSSRVYQKKGSGALIFEKKALKRVEEYYGFEIGGGISSFIGFISSLIPTIESELASNYGLATLTVLFFTVVFGLIGCIIERELRKWNYVPPINVCIVKRDSIALHDVTDVCSVTFGYHLRPLDVSDVSLVEKAAIAWFKLVAGVFYIIYLIVRFLCYVFWVNSAFTLWVFVTVSLALLFYVQITKYDDPLEIAMWSIIITTILAILCCIFVSPCYRREIKIGELSIQQLQTDRLDAAIQNKLFGVFLLCIVFLLICSFFVTWVAGSIDNLSHKYFHTDNYSYDVWNKMVCKDIRGHSFPFGDVPVFDGNAENVNIDDDVEDGYGAFNETQLCDSTNYEFLAVSILLLCILWYLLLATAFWWNQHDQYQLQFSMEGKKSKRKWTQYSYIYIYRKSHSWGIFKNSYYIELTDENARELQHYLNKVCSWYTTPKYVGIHPYSLDFVQQFDTDRKQ